MAVRWVLPWVVALAVAAPGAGVAGVRTTAYFFHAQGCAACAQEERFLDTLRSRVPELEVRAFEVRRTPGNAELLERAAALHGVQVTGVPVLFVGGGEPIAGYRGDATTGAEIEARVRRCAEKGCEDTVAALLGGGERGGRDAPPVPGTPPPPVMSLPLVGATDLSRLPLVALSVVLGALDSFNPCAFFVLLTLLGILVHARSRRRMFLIGGTFVLCSGVVYFLFMAAWLSAFRHLAGLRAATTAAGVVALLIAAVNIKDYFFFRRGVSLTIPEGRKPGLYARMRGLAQETSLPALALGTVVLAVGANTYELLCTAGFPMVFTRVLTLSRLTPAEHYLYLFLYNVVYVVPMAAVVALFSWTLGARKLSEEQGRVMKLVSGLMMLGLGVVVLVDPGLFNNALAGVGLLALSVLVAAAIVAAGRAWGPPRGAGHARPAHSSPGGR